MGILGRFSYNHFPGELLSDSDNLEKKIQNTERRKTKRSLVTICPSG